ncbi:MAG: tail fiber domain-containing protein, partial [bacterium]|nr:tail fiber domain-containing protein [candidate division WOR-3 bacterium]MDH7519768.1 tail fiber domain-containing protein [bacterium]
PRNDSVGQGDSAWVRGTPDSVLYTIRQLGIARGGANNMLYGSARYTHTNLGVACTTGTSGQDYYYCTVGGGYRNTASGNSTTVAGGYRNAASYTNATVGGGYQNTASGYDATVGGGDGNTASGFAATIAGGYGNTASGDRATVGGGAYNTVSGGYATVPGGYYNKATAHYSFAAGIYARANHNYSFVWSDSCSEVNPSDSLYTTGANQWRVRARGGVWFFSNRVMTSGVYLAPGSNSWASACDSANKTDFQPVDHKALLKKLATVPVRYYRMKDQNDGTKHIGPVAQEFYAAFGVGENDKSINMADADGVLFAAIQALYEENQQLLHRIEVLEARLNQGR